MLVLVLGATSRTGRSLLASALAQNHQVIALVRNPSSLTPDPNLTIIAGSPTDKASLVQCFTTPLGVPSGVLTALAHPLATSSPFSAPLVPRFYMRDAISVLVDVMQSYGVKRLVTLSAFGIGQSRANLSWVLGVGFAVTNLGRQMEDHEAVETVLKKHARGHGLEWTLVKPPMLKNASEEEAKGRTGEMGVRTFGPSGHGVWVWDSCTRESVAEFMVGEMVETRWKQGSVVIAN